MIAGRIHGNFQPSREPVHLGGLGLPSNEHGLDERHVALSVARLVYRRYETTDYVFVYVCVLGEFLLPLSHDEVVHGKHSLLAKMPATIGKRKRTIACLSVPDRTSRQKLMFMGGEFGQCMNGAIMSTRWALREEVIIAA